MSSESSIKIRLIEKEYKRNTVEIVNKLINFGWVLGRQGHIFYLPLGDEGAYDWQTKELTTEDFNNIILQKEQMGETIGVELTWINFDIGASFLFWPKNIFETLTINLDANQPRISLRENIIITDFNWYLEKILPPLEEAFGVEYFSCEQHK